MFKSDDEKEDFIVVLLIIGVLVIMYFVDSDVDLVTIISIGVLIVVVYVIDKFNFAYADLLMMFLTSVVLSCMLYFKNEDRDPMFFALGAIVFIVYLVVRIIRMGIRFFVNMIFSLLMKILRYPSYKKSKEKFAEGLSFYQQKNYEGAILKFTESIQSFSYSCETYDNRGMAYAMLGKYNEAITDFKKAIEIIANDAVAYSNLGFTYNRLKNYEQAIYDTTQAIKFDSKCASAYHNRGVAYKNMGENEKAESDFSKARELGYTE